MYQVKFGKKKKTEGNPDAMAPESTEANEFGRYVRYGRRSLFGKRRRSRIGMYNKMDKMNTMFGKRRRSRIGMYNKMDKMNTMFGKRRRSRIGMKMPMNFGAPMTLRFGRQYFGARYPQFGKKKKAPSPDLVAASQGGSGTYGGSYGFGRTRFGNQCDGAPFKPGMFGRRRYRRRAGLRRRRGGLRRRRGGKRMMFGRRRGGLRRRGGRKGSRKGGLKNKKPPAKYLNKAKRLGVKVTRKVGKRRVFKSVKDLKRQIAKKKRLQKKHKRSKKGGRRRRRRSTRFSLFGLQF
jgi:hypothetical protein